MSLLVRGQLVEVPELRTVPPSTHGGPHWATLDPGDYRMRATKWVRQVIVHTTKGGWPQYVRPGGGQAGRAEAVADFWRGDAAHSAAHLVVDLDGTVVCLADLAYTQAHHAEGSNPWSVGIEMYQLGDGGLYEATLDATARLVMALCDLLGIPAQMPRGPYRNAPLRRMETGSKPTHDRDNMGGPTCVGVFGHRDNTSERGAGDPGDAIWKRLAALGCEGLDFHAGEDLLVGKERQACLNARGERLAVDGVCGPASIAAMRRQGFARWRDVA